MRPWERVDTPDGPRFVAELETHEVQVLRNMATSIQEMLDDRQAAAPTDPLEQITGIRTGNSAPPQDATLSRLLPDFVSEQPGRPADASANGALRSLHEPAIIDAKIAAAQRILDTLPRDAGRIALTEADAEAWIAAVNDLRLALGTMLGIGPDFPDRLPPKDPKAMHHDVYLWLTLLQEYLVLGLMGKPGR